MTRWAAGSVRRRSLLALAVVVTGILLALVPAAPASAHAVLLNTEPAAQSTLTAPPTRVRLQFSEPVEAAFGNIRVVDNSGHDVTAGRPVRVDNGREVDVPVKPGQGTTYVAWKVVSSDGHSVWGTFAFFVGAPSRGASRGIPLDAGASAAAGWLYGAARFGWFAALFLLLGLVVVGRWVWPAAVSAAHLAGSDEEDRANRRLRRLLGGAWVMSIVSGAGVIVGQGAADAGRPLTWAARPSAVRQVLQTSAGHHWLIALAVAAAVGLPLALLDLRRRRDPWRGPYMAALVGLVLTAVATAEVGHARTLRHASLGVASLSVHLVAVGVWVGGLASLLLLGAPAWARLTGSARSAFAAALVRGFSRLAVLAVAGVVASGLVSAILDLGSARDLVDLPYGRVLLVKIVLLQVALVLGARHLWFVPDELDNGADAAGSFGRSAVLELGVLALTVVAATGLMVMQPGRSAADAAASQILLGHRDGDRSLNASVTPDAPGTDQLTVVFVRGAAFDKAIRRPVVRVAALTGTRTPVDVPMVWVADGRFTGAVDLPNAGHYRLTVAPGPGAAPVTLGFRVAAASAATAAPPGP